MTVFMFTWLIWRVGDFEPLLSGSLGRASRYLILGMPYTPILESCGNLSNLHGGQSWLMCHSLKFHT